MAIKKQANIVRNGERKSKNGEHNQYTVNGLHCYMWSNINKSILTSTNQKISTVTRFLDKEVCKCSWQNHKSVHKEYCETHDSITHLHGTLLKPRQYNFEKQSSPNKIIIC